MAIHRFGGRGNLFSKRGKSISNLLRRGRGNYKLSRFLSPKQKKYFLEKLKPHMKGRGVTVRSKGSHHASELESVLGRMKMDTKDPISKRETIMLEREIEREQAQIEQVQRQEQQQQRELQHELLEHIREQGSSIGFEPTAGQESADIQQPSPDAAQSPTPIGRVPYRGATTIPSYVQPSVVASSQEQPKSANDRRTIAASSRQPRQIAGAQPESPTEPAVAPTPAQSALPTGRRVVVDVGDDGVQAETELEPHVQADSAESRSERSQTDSVELPPVLA